MQIPDGIGGSGIYALFNGETLVYIGQAINVMKRLAAHTETKDFTHAAFVSVPRDLLNEVERGLINAYLPRLNRDSSTESLRRNSA